MMFLTEFVKAFIDDLVLISCSEDLTQKLLGLCATALTLAGMMFRASKSRSLIMLNGKVFDKSPFSVHSDTIPSIHSNPIKFLGRTIDMSLKDKCAIENLNEKF